jgi:dihydropteroate synthase
MGVLNATPDSFSDGGRFESVAEAVATGERMANEGAAWIDVGGESTRPGAEPVDPEVETQRVVPVICALAEAGVAVSCDTRHAEVARAALSAGAKMINDVSGLRDPQMRQVVAEFGAEVVIMHMPGEPRTMASLAEYQDVAREVREYLLAAASEAEQDGIAKERIWIDPGIGFGKDTRQNIALLKCLPELVSTGYPVLVGASRKRFILEITDEPEPLRRLPGTLAVHLFAARQGVQMVRCHDVAEHVQALRMQQALEN